MVETKTETTLSAVSFVLRQLDLSRPDAEDQGYARSYEETRLRGRLGGKSVDGYCLPTQVYQPLV